MIIKGNSRRSIGFWVRHLTNTTENDRAELIEQRGLMAEDLRGMMCEMQDYASVSKRCKNFMHIASFNPQAHEHLTEEQWEQAFHIYEKHRGIPANQQRIVIEHEKKGRVHRHVIWQRVDLETARAFPDGLNFRVCEAAQNEIEETLGLEKTPHLLNREPEAPRPEPGPKSWEIMRGNRSGIDPRDVTAEITEIFRQSENGADFVNGLPQHGYQFVEGNRAFCVLDPAGDVHSLAKRIEGINTKELKAFMRDVDLSHIPTVEQAQAEFRERREAELKNELAIIDQQIEAEQAPLIADLARRYINDLDAYHAEMPGLYERAPDTAHEVQKRVNAALHAEIDQHFPDRMQELLDELFPGNQPQARQAEHRQAPPWDREAAEMAWQDSIINAAIENEWHQQRYVARDDHEREARAGRLDPEKKPAREPEKAKPYKPPELGKTQAEIRLARTLTPGPQSFASALEDRGFILARITPADIEKEMQQRRAEWEERRRNPQSWMEHEGGFKALSPELQDSARRSFDAWEKQERERQNQQDRGGAKASLTPEVSADDIQKRLESYVDYVQRKWAEGPTSQLERATGGLAVVTPFGNLYSLTPRNTGLDRDELPEYLKGIDRAPLLTVTDAQAVIQELRDHRRDEWQAQQPLSRTAGEIRLAYSLTQTGQEFANALEDRGLILARMTDTDAERLNRWERQRLKEQAQAREQTGKAAPNPQDKYRAGELVVVNQYGQVFQLTRHNTDQDKDQRLKEIDPAPLLSVTAAQGVMKEFQQHRQEGRRQAWEQQREAWRQPMKERHWPVMPMAPERKSSRLFEQAAQEASRDQRTDNLTGPAAQIWNAFWQSGTEDAFQAFIDGKEKLSSFRTGDRQAFAGALDEKGIAFAIATKEEADISHRQAEFAKTVGNYAPRFKEGEIVIVTSPRLEYRRDGEIMEPSRVWKLDQALAEKYVKLLDNRSQLLGIEATKQALNERGQQRAAERQAERLENAIKQAPTFAPLARKAVRLTRRTVHESADIAMSPARAIGGLLNAGASAAGILFSLVDAPKSPRVQEQENREGRRSTARQNAEAEIEIDFSRHVAEQMQEQHNRQQEQAARDRQRELGRER